MKKLICNIGALALGLLASIMAFVPMFDIKMTAGDKSEFADQAFSIFKCQFADADGFKDTFRVITMILAIIAIAAFVILAITVVMDFLGGKKSNMAGIKKLACLVLVIVAILIVIASIIFMAQNKESSSSFTVGLAISNWFAYLSVALGFAGAGILAFCAKK